MESHITFKNCKISGFTTYAFVSKMVNELMFINSEFINCVYKYNDWHNLQVGGVIHTEDIDNDNENDIKIKIDNCRFLDCGARNSDAGEGYRIFSNDLCEVTNSKFINCRYYVLDTSMSVNENAFLFAKGSICKNNEVIDSLQLVRG